MGVYTSFKFAPRATDFGFGSAHTWGSRVWVSAQVSNLRLGQRISDLGMHMPVLNKHYRGPLFVPHCLGNYTHYMNQYTPICTHNVSTQMPRIRTRVKTIESGGLEFGGLESRGLDSGGLESAGIESRGTDFGSGVAHACGGLESGGLQSSGNGFRIWSCT